MKELKKIKNIPNKSIIIAYQDSHSWDFYNPQKKIDGYKEVKLSKNIRETILEIWTEQGGVRNGRACMVVDGKLIPTRY